ncbi:MAG: deoxyribonuclease IV [Oscillospiraceae bacterium]|jgi:deoxyribonuclease-4|nr:deoxyribonuclease IV [Oscillospiraceae bacterium]
MLNIGAHLSVSKGLEQAGKDALQIGANTFQIFLRNPRGARAKPADGADTDALRRLTAENGFAPIVVHAPYTMNACSTQDHVRRLAESMIADDLERMEDLPGNYYNFHPGSRMGQEMGACTAMIADMLNRVIAPEQKTIVLLETMSGKGSEIGASFGDLYAIMTQVRQQDKIGICFDLCHLWDGGHDMVKDLDGVLDSFDRTIGLQYLRAVHVNDSLNALGSRKDRHAEIGRGVMGLDAVVRIICHPKLRGLPFILETPTDLNGHAAEIAMLKDAYGKNT